MTRRAAPVSPYLAFDTSGVPGSVVVRTAAGTVGPVVLRERDDHAAQLVPAIDEVLSRAEVGVGALKGILVGEGPGSFTGVRVSAATAKALAGALGVHLWAISSLAAAATASGISSVQYVLFDARADRIYGACYDVGPTQVETLIPPHGGALGEVLSSDLPEGCVFTGGGSVKHRAAIQRSGFGVEAAPEGSGSLAEGLLRYMDLATDLEPIADVASWEPRYVRASSVERQWSL